jgi:uncharacterized protein (TIGR02118 family)
MSDAAHLVVLYHTPTDPAAFEKYYSETHLPIVEKHAKEIGFTKIVYLKFAPDSAFYRKAELTFESIEALKKGTRTAGFKAVGDDIPNFATGGFTALTGVETD